MDFVRRRHVWREAQAKGCDRLCFWHRNFLKVFFQGTPSLGTAVFRLFARHSLDFYSGTDDVGGSALALGFQCLIEFDLDIAVQERCLGAYPMELIESSL
jgi:hypothetical protein